MDRKALTSAQARYEKRAAELRSAMKKARAERDAVFRKAHREGMTMRAIGEIVGMSHQRVAQIIWGDTAKPK